MGWIECKCDAHKKQVGVGQLYNPGATGSQLVGDQSLKSVFQFEKWEPDPAEAGSPGPRLSSTGEWERNAAIAGRAGGRYVAVFVQSQIYLSHITFHNPFVTIFE